MTSDRPLILVTNDDGIVAPGLRALVEATKKFGRVVVVAPNAPQSGQGHAITIEVPIHIDRIELFEGVESYECTGTPVDCVKLATNVILKGQRIDLCLSGINHGSNASINILYSGTMSAAMEASLEGIPSIGFSLDNYSMDADMRPAQHIAERIIDYVLRYKMRDALLWNVNIPDLPLEQIKGIKLTRQAKGKWQESFQEGINPRGRKYYWLTGTFVPQDNGSDTDLKALKEGYVSIVPTGHDLTVRSALQSNKDVEGIL